MKYFPENCLYLIKYKNQKKRIWLKCSSKRKVLNVMNYWRKRNDFQYCKVFIRSTLHQIYWFNNNTEGFPSDNRKTNFNVN